MTGALVYRASLRVGEMLGSVPLASCEPIVRPDGRWRIKRRRRGAAVVVAVGNACLALSGVPQRMLRRDAWTARESEMYELAHGARVERLAPGTVLLPELPGIPLGALLAPGRTSAAERRAALAAAAAALAALHRLVARGPNGAARTVSHGDATVSNVMYDPRTGRASWLDFDVTHAAGQSELARRVDDLRTFAYSVGSRLAPHEYPLVPATFASGYGDRAVLRALRVRMGGRSSVLLPVWVAQVPSSLAGLRAFEAALCAGLEETF